MYASTLPRSNWLRRASIRLAWYRHMPASSSDMHHPVSGINSLIHSVSLAGHVSSYLLIHLSAHLYYHHHSHHPSLLHSRLRTYLFNKSFPSLYTSFAYRTAFMTTHTTLFAIKGSNNKKNKQRYCTGPIILIVLFLVSHFNFLFVPCGRLSWILVSFLLHVKYTPSYRIVSFKDGIT